MYEASVSKVPDSVQQGNLASVSFLRLAERCSPEISSLPCSLLLGLLTNQDLLLKKHEFYYLEV